MSWKMFLLLLRLNAVEFCDSVFIENKNCTKEVIECVLDGESFEWCTVGG